MFLHIEQQSERDQFCFQIHHRKLKTKTTKLHSTKRSGKMDNKNKKKLKREAESKSKNNNNVTHNFKARAHRYKRA